MLFLWNDFITLTLNLFILVMGAESIPEWPAYILGVLCLLVVVVQPLGFIGIRREKYRLFRRFHYLNTLLTFVVSIKYNYTLINKY